MGARTGRRGWPSTPWPSWPRAGAPKAYSARCPAGPRRSRRPVASRLGGLGACVTSSLRRDRSESRLTVESFRFRSAELPWPEWRGPGMPGTEYRRRAEECVRLAQTAKPRHRAVLLEIASKWLELSDRDAATQALLDEVETTKRPAIWPVTCKRDASLPQFMQPALGARHDGKLLKKIQ